MSDETFDLESVDGAHELALWFGRWPSFHDAEVLDILLSRDKESVVNLDVWECGTDLDVDGNFVIRKRAIVSFFLSEVTDLSLDQFNEQNVISELMVEKGPATLTLWLKPCFGVAGKITAKSARLTFEEYQSP